MLGRFVSLVAVVAAMILAGLAPAVASGTPSQVGLVTFTNASLNGSNATLTFNWPKPKNARSYEVFVSTSYSKLPRARVAKTTSKTMITISWLKPGTNYYVQVRARNGKKVGNRSQRVGRTTISSHGSNSGPTYSVMTYNICSEQPGCLTPWSWEQRRPRVLGVVAYYRPDVLMLQESKNLAQSDTAAIPGYTRAAYYSSKALFIKTGRFDIVPLDGTQTGWPPGTFASCEAATDQRIGCIDLGGKYAVWAELSDREAAGKRVVFVSVHLTSGKSESSALKRKAETQALISGINEINPQRLPVVIGGDFNSHRNRPADYPGWLLKAAGFGDGFDLAESVSRQHYNSYNGFRPKPTLSVTWGDHNDHVWAQPGRVRVQSWANVGPIRDGVYSSPIPSDHNPILVRLRVN